MRWTAVILARVNPLLCALVLAAWPELPFPPGQSLNAETSSEVSFSEITVMEGDKPLKVRGRRWRGYAQSSNSAVELWAQWKPLLLAKGWKVTSEKQGHSLERTGGKTEWRLTISAPDSGAPGKELTSGDEALLDREMPYVWQPSGASSRNLTEPRSQG